MTIDDKIAELKAEIEVAESALKAKVTDLDFGEILKDFGSNLLTSPGGKEDSNSLLSYLPTISNKKKYAFLFNILRLIKKIK